MAVTRRREFGRPSSSVASQTLACAAYLAAAPPIHSPNTRIAADIRRDFKRVNQ